MAETLITTKEVQEKVHLSVLDVLGKCYKISNTPEVFKQLKQYFKNFAFNTDCIVKTQADNDDTLIVELCFTYGSILYTCLYRMGKFLVTYYTTIDDQLVECFKIQRNSYNQEVFNLQELVKLRKECQNLQQYNQILKEQNEAYRNLDLRQKLQEYLDELAKVEGD